MKYLRIILIITLLTLLCSLSAMAVTPNANVLQRATEIISKMETNGNYASVSNDSNNCPSVGILQWNNGRAVRLVRSVIEADKTSAKSILGETLYNQILNGSDSIWNGKKLDADTRGAIGRLLNTDIGRAKQDALAKQDISAYIVKAMELGIKDGNALVYYADIAHQAGTGAVKKYAVKASELAGSYAKITLKDMYNAALCYATYTKTRRTKVYNLLLENPVKGTENEEDDDKTEETSKVKPKSVKLNQKGTVTLLVGDTLELQATLAPENASTTLTWKSTKASVASIENGIVTAKKAGKATVGVVTANGKKATVKIVVKNIPVKTITLSGKTEMSVKEIQQISAEILPTNAYNQKLVWKSSNKKILLVNSKGQVKAVKKGTATIAARSTDGSKVIAKIKITVS